MAQQHCEGQKEATKSDDSTEATKKDDSIKEHICLSDLKHQQSNRMTLYP